MKKIRNAEEIRANARAEGRVAEVYESWSGRYVEVEVLNEEEKEELNKYYAERNERLAREVEEEKKARENKRLAKAEKLGVSEEELKKIERRKRHEREIKRLEKAIAELEAEKRRLEELVKKEG